MIELPIDRSFKQTWTKQGRHQGHTIWQSSHSKLGIHGTRVAVNLDECTGCLKCISVCPVAVFIQWTPEPGQVVVDPANEDACLECLACELVCPVDVVLITRTPSKGDTLSALLD